MPSEKPTNRMSKKECMSSEQATKCNAKGNVWKCEYALDYMWRGRCYTPDQLKTSEAKTKCLREGKNFTPDGKCVDKKSDTDLVREKAAIKKCKETDGIWDDDTNTCMRDDGNNARCKEMGGIAIRDPDGAVRCVERDQVEDCKAKHKAAGKKCSGKGCFNSVGSCKV